MPFLIFSDTVSLGGSALPTYPRPLTVPVAASSVLASELPMCLRSFWAPRTGDFCFSMFLNIPSRGICRESAVTLPGTLRRAGLAGVLGKVTGTSSFTLGFSFFPDSSAFSSGVATSSSVLRIFSLDLFSCLGGIGGNRGALWTRCSFILSWRRRSTYSCDSFVLKYDWFRSAFGLLDLNHLRNIPLLLFLKTERYSSETLSRSKDRTTQWEAPSSRKAPEHLVQQRTPKGWHPQLGFFPSHMTHVLFPSLLTICSSIKIIKLEFISLGS